MDMLYITKVAPGEIGLTRNRDSADSEFTVGLSGVGKMLNVLRGCSELEYIEDPNGEVEFVFKHFVEPFGYAVMLGEGRAALIPYANANVLSEALASACDTVARAKGAW